MVSNMRHPLKVNILAKKERCQTKRVETVFDDPLYQTKDILLKGFDMNPISNKLSVFYRHDLVNMTILENAFQDHVLKNSKNNLELQLVEA
jgi:hypothetical protein